jgi:HlyD family secretion protein
MASSDVFRKVALERMSSPEQLDQILRVTTPKGWLALLAILALLSSAVVWGFKGQLTTKVFGEGVLIRSGGVQNIVPLGVGQVLDIRVKVGDHVSIGQVIGTVAQPAILERIRIAKSQLADSVRQKEEVFKVRSDRARLQLDYLKRERFNIEREIQELQQQAKIVQSQITVDEELLTKGLVTKLQVYTTRQQLVSVQGNISSKQARITQLDAASFQAENENLETNLQDENKIADLKREIGILERQLDAESKVISPYAGSVLEVKVSPGSVVQVGTPILSLHPDVEHLEVLVYVPAAKAKDVRPGMLAEISPSTVKREEYGFIRGKVSFVSEYPATEEALMRIYQNAPLVRSLGAGGPITQVHLDMEVDPNTPSGYRWSSPLGAPLKLSDGTFCIGEIITREQKPISMILPLIKERLGMR